MKIKPKLFYLGPGKTVFLMLTVVHLPPMKHNVIEIWARIHKEF